MPIALHCKDCDSDFHVKDELVGKTIRCPKCNEATIRVPNLVPAKHARDQWKFKGLDGQEYGPVSKQDLDQWVTEGRVNEQTQIQAPGQSQWQSAASFYPSLNSPSAPQTSGYSPASHNQSQPQAQANAPAYAQQTSYSTMSGFQCPYCRTTAPPFTQSEVSQAGWIVMVVLILTCLPLFWIGLLIKDTFNKCSGCGARVG